MQSEYASNYRKLYQNHWWWRSRESYILRILQRWQQQEERQETREILDVGCGDGLFFPALKSFGNVHGVESDPQIVEPDGPFAPRIHIGDFDSSFQPDQQFHWITMLDVIEHIPDATQALQHAGELLTTNGRILITVPAFNLLWTQHDEYNLHQRRYTKRLLKQQATAAGVKVQQMKYLFHWTFPVKLLIRLKESLTRGTPRSAQVPPAVINGCCHFLCRIEQRILTPLRMPFGSSLVAVCKKQ